MKTKLSGDKNKGKERKKTMKVENIETYNSKTSFRAKVSQHFIDTAHNFFNYGIIENRRKNVYLFNQKVEQYKGFGFDDYVLDYEKFLDKSGYKHHLVASKTKDGKTECVILGDKNTLKGVIMRFMKMNRFAFKHSMKNCPRKTNTN